MFKNEAGRQIEAHLQILVDYDVIEAAVADTLTEYIWSVIGEIDEVVNVDSEEEEDPWGWLLENGIDLRNRDNETNNESDE